MHYAGICSQISHDPGSNGVLGLEVSCLESRTRNRKLKTPNFPAVAIGFLVDNMATQTKCYEEYPLWIVFISNLVSFTIYAIGGYIIYQIGIVWLAAYLFYILLLEIRVMRKSCTNCYYYGKLCAFGKGKISPIFFKKGDAAKFSQCSISWKDILPDFLVSLIPLLVGVALLAANFNFLVLFLLILLVILASAGNGFVRSSLACKYCKQKEIGCPAEKLFKKRK